MTDSKIPAVYQHPDGRVAIDRDGVRHKPLRVIISDREGGFYRSVNAEKVPDGFVRLVNPYSQDGLVAVRILSWLYAEKAAQLDRAREENGTLTDQLDAESADKILRYRHAAINAATDRDRMRGERDDAIREQDVAQSLAGRLLKELNAAWDALAELSIPVYEGKGRAAEPGEEAKP